MKSRITWAPHSHPHRVSFTQLCDTSWVEQCCDSSICPHFFCRKEARFTREEDTDHYQRVEEEQARELLRIRHDLASYQASFALKPVDFRNITVI